MKFTNSHKELLLQKYGMMRYQGTFICKHHNKGNKEGESLRT